MINYSALVNNAELLRQRFLAAYPYRHLILENFLETDWAETILRNFPDPEQMKVRESKTSFKLYLRDPKKLDLAVKRLFEEFACGRFLTLLSQMTGIPDLHADPSLQGAGYHQGTNGSFLDVHADFNFHEPLQMHRRLNILIYFNKDWKREYNGYLEVWDKELKVCKMIKPSFNRCVLIETTDVSYHGYLAIKVPEYTTRKSLAVYFYTPTRPAEGTVAPHGTLYQQRPQKYDRAIVD